MGFFEFNIAMSGLFTAQKGLQVTGNNISNANTAGYSKQVVTQKASNPISGIGVGMTGTGSTVASVNRLRNSYLDTKLWKQNAALGENNIKVAQSSVIESVFGEPSDLGFTKVFNNVFSTVDNLSKDPASSSYQSIMKQELTTFTKYYNTIAGALNDYRDDLNADLRASVEEINNLANRIQNLNTQIFQTELYGNEASTFRDERDLCIDRLSKIINVEVSESDAHVDGEIVTDTKGNIMKKMTVKIAGQTLVDHYQVNNLKIEADKQDMYQISWDNGLSFDMADVNMSGELKGIIDMRDGVGTNQAGKPIYNGIPYYVNRLDNYVQTFARTMNETYSKDKHGNIEIDPITVNGIEVTAIKKNSKGEVEAYFTGEGESRKRLTVDAADQVKFKEAIDIQYTTKYKLFSYSTGNKTGSTADGKELKGNDYRELTAENFSISKEIFDDPSNLRVSFDIDNVSDGSLWSEINALKDDKTMFKQGDPKDYMVAVFSQLGINAQQAEMYQSTQKAVTNNIINQRLSVSQVDTSEEFTYLIKYQQAYQAAAKMMNTIDGIYETTIFKLGNF